MTRPDFQEVPRKLWTSHDYTETAGSNRHNWRGCANWSVSLCADVDGYPSDIRGSIENILEIDFFSTSPTLSAFSMIYLCEISETSSTIRRFAFSHEFRIVSVVRRGEDSKSS